MSTAYSGNEYWETGPLKQLAFSLLGIVLYGLAAIALLLWTRSRFTAVTGRLPLPGATPCRVPACM
jgi:hypothetical protein